MTDVATQGSEHDADANFVRSTHHHVSHDPVEPDDGEQSGKYAEYSREAGDQPFGLRQSQLISRIWRLVCAASRPMDRMHSTSCHRGDRTPTETGFQRV
jgi:hypothetical protein